MDFEDVVINRDLTDAEKYKIYKKYGIEYLSRLIGESIESTRSFIGNYFKNCCLNVVDNCIYKDIFVDTDKEKDKNNQILFEEKEKYNRLLIEEKIEKEKEEEKKRIEKEFGFGVHDILTLIVNRGNKGAFQNEIWKLLGMNRRQCSRILQELEKKGIITREHAVVRGGARTYRVKFKYDM